VWRRQWTPYIHCLDRSKEGFWQIVPRSSGDGGFCARAVVQWRRRRRRLACARGRAVAVEETSGVESGIDLENFGMKSETPRNELLFIGLKLSSVILN
jgi:hypothetical protein